VAALFEDQGRKEFSDLKNSDFPIAKMIDNLIKSKLVYNIIKTQEMYNYAQLIQVTSRTTRVSLSNENKRHVSDFHNQIQVNYYSFG